MDPAAEPPIAPEPAPDTESRLRRRERRAFMRQAFGTKLLTTFATWVTVVTALVFLLSFFLIHETAHEALEEELGRRLEDVAALVAYSLRDHAFHPEVRDTNAARRELSEAIAEQQSQLGVSAIVVFVHDAELEVLASTRQGDQARSGEAGRLLADALAIERALERKGAVSSSLYQDPLGGADGPALLKSGYAPVLDPDGDAVALVGVELPAEFQTAVAQVAWRFSVLGTLAGLTVLLTAVFLVRQRVHVPIYRLVRSMRGTEDGTPQPARVRWNDEIGVLTEHYNDMVDRLAAKDRELRDLYDRAREQADYLQGYSNYLVDGVPHGVVAVDDQGVLTVWNPGAAQILRREGQRGAPLEGQLDADHPLCRALVGALRDGSVTSQAMIVLEEDEGQQRLLELSCAPFRGDQGELLGAAALVDDRTELEQLRRAASRNERLAAIGNLGAGLAHEIKNPLGAISGFAELIQRKEGQDAARLAGRLRDEVLELDRFLKEFLAFARDDRIRREPCDLNEVLLRGVELGLTGMGLGPAEVQALFEGQTAPWRDATITLGLDLADDLPTLALDAGLIRSACANLAANAFQVMPAGGRLEITTQRRGKLVSLRFRDDGPGVPLQDRERIFDPLFTTRAEGTGLGLAITHKAINAQGGEIVVRDAPGGGAEFVIRLPVIEAEVGQQADALTSGT